MSDTAAELRDCPTRDVDASHYTAGDVLGGKYRLERLLGEGGMGSVWLARNLDLDSNVAIKLVRWDVPSDELAERLKREACAAARLLHRAIVKVYDFDRTREGCPFIVMEALEGESLASILERTRSLAPVVAVNLLLPIIDALVEAHDAGIVHRDIKPENVFLSRSARMEPKLLDFGIAKLDRGGWNRRSITINGTVLGTPSYMSPEQALGLPDVDHRTDIWAVCAVLYEAVAGVPPFPEAANYHRTLRRIIEDEIPPLRDPKDGRAALWGILSRGLEKDRARRFSSMRALGAALSEFVATRVERAVGVDDAGAAEPGDGRSSVAPVSISPRQSTSSLGPPRSRPIRAAKAVLIAAALAGGFIFARLSPRQSESVASAHGGANHAPAVATAGIAPLRANLPSAETSARAKDSPPGEPVPFAPLEGGPLVAKTPEVRRTVTPAPRPAVVQAGPRAWHRRRPVAGTDLKDPYP